MEASDAFAKGVEIEDGDDPFKGSDFGDFDAGEGGPTGELKTVDKEGNEVDPTSEEPAESAGPTEATPEQYAAKAAAEAPAEARPEPTTPPAGEEAPAAPAPDPTEGESASSSTTDSPPASPSSETATEPSSEPSSASEPEDAPAPEETADDDGKKTKRRYVILQLDGPGKFTQVAWHVDADGKMVPRGTQGAKRQTVALVRGTDEALKIGFAAVGAPADGAQLVAVAALYFQVKKIKPLPPEPSKQRLQIG